MQNALAKRFPTIGGYLRFIRVAWLASPGYTLLVGLVTVAMIGVPLVAIVVVGRILTNLPAAVSGGPDSAQAHSLSRLALLAGVLVAIQWAAYSAREASCEALGDRVNHRLQSDLMREVMAPPGIAHLENPATMDLISVGRDTFAQWMRPGRLAWELTLLLSARGLLIGAAVVLTTFQWWAGPAFLAAVLWAEREGRSVAKKATDVHFDSTAEKRRAHYFFTLGTEPGPAKEVRVFGLGDFLLGGYQTSWDRSHADAFRSSSRREMLATATLGLVAVGLLAWMCTLAARAQLGIGQAIVYAQAMLVGLTALGTATASRLRTTMALKMLSRHEQAIAAVGVRPGAPPTRTLPAGAPLQEIRFEQVSFRYPDSGVERLRGLDLVIPAGTSVAIVGENGVGKTTLIKLLCGLYPPTSGRVLVDGVDLAELDPHRWQRHVAAVFQDNVKYELSAADNVALGAVEHLDDRHGVEAAADTAGVADVVKGMARGWDTVLSTQHQGGSELSGGEWQKIALARAIFAVRHGAGVLVLDEPAAHLDARSEARLYEQYLDLTKGATTIVVSHRFSTVRQADTIVVIQDGKVSEAGTHDELIARGGYYATMFALQAANFELDDAAGSGGETDEAAADTVETGVAR
ncbi:ABC transporter ATP-binding protein [Plantactinospora sp. WMMC1484]|uniref:ABC transporter ATP-binding protein n=1 Tax=Plantactinospora sp. WMMC1484 TaxID=3404122 RepID=UPI003BF5C99F